MPRQAREESGTGIYHVMMRGVNHQNIFEDTEDYYQFLITLDRMKVQYNDFGLPCSSNCTYYAYCLMSNHFHLLIRERGEKVGYTIKRIASLYVLSLICHPKVFVDSRQGEPLNDMQKHYVRMLPDYPNKELITEFDQLVEFMAGQFAKRVPKGQNYQYMISAYFAQNGLTTDEGILYPSVQTKGHLGFNIALRPDVKEESLEFIDAQWCILYKAKEYLPVPEGKYTDEEIAMFMDINDINQLPWIN